MDLEKVLLSPIITEKSQNLQTIGESLGKRTVQYSFYVHPDANKVLVKQAIFHLYKIKPDSVNIAVLRGKMKRFRNLPSRRPVRKKAVVTFLDGANLEFAKV